MKVIRIYNSKNEIVFNDTLVISTVKGAVIRAKFENDKRNLDAAYFHIIDNQKRTARCYDMNGKKYEPNVDYSKMPKIW